MYPNVRTVMLPWPSEYWKDGNVISWSHCCVPDLHSLKGKGEVKEPQLEGSWKVSNLNVLYCGMNVLTVSGLSCCCVESIS